MRTQAEKCAAFRELHERPSAFIIPNPWDIGTARILAHLGFEALATTSAGYAFSIGRRDNAVGRELMMAHARDIVSATDLPVSADLENGFGDAPADAAHTIRLAAAAGLAGCSIEDSTGRADERVYDFALAVERIRAAAEAAKSLPYHFTLTARSENFLVGRPDLDDTIKRLQSFQEAGANVLYAPGLTRAEDIASLVSSVDRPVNVLMGLSGVRLTLADLSALGVKRVSIGSGLSRVALGALIRVAREMLANGTFDFADEAVGFKDVSAMFEP